MKSSGKSFSIGSSVDPGLPNIVVIPWARKTSKEASRTLLTGPGLYTRRQTVTLSDVTVGELVV